MLVGEVAGPETPALGAMIWIAVLLFAFAFVWVVRKLVNALFTPLIASIGWIPFAGQAAEALLTKIEQWVSNALGLAEGAIDAQLGASFHLLARYTDWLWREIRGHAALLLEIAAGIAPLYEAYQALKSLVNHHAKAQTGDTARVKRLEKEYRGIDVRIRHLEKEFRGIDDTGVQKRLHTLDKEIAKVQSQTIPAIQQADRDAATAISNLYEWIKGKASIIGIGTFATAVTAAIATVGNGWLGCKENPFSSSRNPCGLWADLARFLPLLGLLAIGFDFPEFVQAAETVAQGIGGAVGAIEGTFALELPPLPPPA